jgi:hypothetical protein
MGRLYRALLVGCLVVAITLPAFGSDSDLERLTKRVDDLEKRVELLSQTLTILMQTYNAGGVQPKGLQTSAPDSQKWKDKQNWRALRSGSSKDEVTSLLGEPDKIQKFTSFEIWYYGYPGGGSVNFSSNGKVEAWSEP